MWGVRNPKIVLPEHCALPRVLWLIAKGFTSSNSCGRSHMWQVVKTSHDSNSRQGQIAPFFCFFYIFLVWLRIAPLGIHHGPKRYIVSHTLFPCFHVNRIAGPCYQSDRPFSFRWMEWRWPLLDFLVFEFALHRVAGGGLPHLGSGQRTDKFQKCTPFYNLCIP